MMVNDDVIRTLDAIYFEPLGEVVYEKKIANYPAEERMNRVKTYLSRVREEMPLPDEDKPTPNQVRNIIRGMQGAAEKLGHDDVVKYLATKLDD